jgi:hypothetical protein
MCKTQCAGDQGT